MNGCYSQSGNLIKKKQNLNLIMKIPILKIVQSMVPVFVLISLFSCSKDTDLLADYVISDLHEARFIGNLAISDNFVVAPEKSIVLDVLANDTFTDPDKVKIVETSQPENGTVVINEDKTLTYYPDTSDAPAFDTENGSQNPQEVEEDYTPEQNDTKEETPKEEETQPAPEKENTGQKPEEGETEQAQHTETEQKKEEEKGTITETFDYSVESTDEQGNKTIQEATVTLTTDLGELKAFPSADGYGKYTTGGRGGYVIHVTNLNDSGPGSLRAALYAKGKRTVVFDVSGYIDLVKTLSIRDPHITIAGQTAPGGGITVRGANIAVRTSNVIIRYLRVRPGYNASPGSECINILANEDNLNIDGILIDHCSLSWSLDENLAFGAGSAYSNNSIKNVTVQNCLNSEALNYYAVLMGQNLSRISLIRNLFANNDNRIPESSYGDTPESYEFVNNIIYNYGRPTKIAYGVNADVIGNVYKANATPAVPNLQYARNSISNPNGKPTDGKIFSIDNLQIGKNPKGMTNHLWDENNRSSRVLTDSPYKPNPAADLEKTLLSDVGANVFNDPVDSRIIREYWNNGGKRGPRHESEVGGYPSLAEERYPYDYDSDRDGMADKWELENGMDPNNPNDGKAFRNGDGYTNLEAFLHHLVIVK